MSSLIHQNLLQLLKKMAQTFVWGRKTLHKRVLSELEKIEDMHNALSDKYEDSLLSNERQKNTIDEKITEIAKYQDELKKANSLYQEYANKFSLLEVVNGDLNNKFQGISKEYSELKEKHGDTWVRFSLISKLLSVKPLSNNGLSKFRKLLYNDYIKFSSDESSLAEEALAFSMLQSIEREIVLLISHKDILSKTVVGVFGAVSSGKSSFINSFIKTENIKLAVGLNPVTAIPNYVLQGDREGFKGCSKNGGHIDIDPKFYEKMSHASIEGFNFDLRSIMPFVCANVVMKHEFLDEICFLDTPGYDPAKQDVGYSHNDENISSGLVGQCNVILWVIASDNGDITRPDIEFIQNYIDSGAEIYLIVNKADLKSEDDLKDVLDQTEETLKEEGINIKGISGYSSIECKELAYRGISLNDYLCIIKEKNIHPYTTMISNINHVFSMYNDSILRDINKIKKIKSSLNDFSLDALEINRDLYNKISKKMKPLEGDLGVDSLENLEKLLRRSKQMNQDFIDAASLACCGE